MLNPIQLEALNEIERQVAKIRAADVSVIEVKAPPLQSAITSAPPGSILDLMDNTFTERISIGKPLTIRRGTINAPPNANEIINIINGAAVNLTNLNIVGDGTTKNGIIAHGKNMMFDDINILNIRRIGQETHAIAMWDSIGPLTVKNSTLEAGSICFLAGGAKATVPNTIPTGLVFDNCLMTRQMAWKGQGYACKNAFELKCARDVLVKNCILENVWAEGQSGYAIVLTPSTTDDINSNQTVVERVLFDSCIIRNVGYGVNALGFTQHPDFPTQRGNNYKFVNNQWEIKRALGGHGGLVLLSWEPKDVVFQGNTSIEDGDAFIRMADSKPVEGFRFQGNTVKNTGTYGVFAPGGNIRGIGWNTICPDGIMDGNTFSGAHSTFKTNFPNNIYV